MYCYSLHLFYLLRNRVSGKNIDNKLTLGATLLVKYKILSKTICQLNLIFISNLITSVLYCLTTTQVHLDKAFQCFHHF